MVGHGESVKQVCKIGVGLASISLSVAINSSFKISDCLFVLILLHAGVGYVEIDAAGPAVILNHHIVLLMLCVDIGNLFVKFSQLHVVAVQLIVVHHLVYLLHPLVVHEHLIVPTCNCLLPSHELLVLRFHLESICLYIIALIQQVIIAHWH